MAELTSNGNGLKSNEIRAGELSSQTMPSSVPEAAEPGIGKASKGAKKKKSGNGNCRPLQDEPPKSTSDVKGSNSRATKKKTDKEKRYSVPSSSELHGRRSPERSQCGGSDAYSDASSKVNCSGNLRKAKKGKRASVPNSNAELREMNDFFPDNPSPRPKSARVPEKRNSTFRSKTPDCQPSGLEKARPQVKKPGPCKKAAKFEPYIPLFQVQQGLKRGEFIEGAMRINPRSYEDAYVNSPDGKMDIYIGGMHNRNRALNGDIVVVQINPKQEWRVLCDAIKDYEEKGGTPLADTICTPIPSPPCKIHTPDKLSRQSRPQSSNSWGSTSGDRQPDTLKILGVDELVKQMDDFSLHARTKNRRKGAQNCQGESTPKSCSTHSHESSESGFDQASPKFEHGTSDVQVRTSMGNGKIHPARSINEIDSVDSNLKQNSNAWESEESSVDIIVSPVELLTIDGNSILEKANQNLFGNDDSDGSDFNGVIVPPGELSGDEFTDSASIGSTESSRLDQTLEEDTSFLASQQDADNNNVSYDNVVLLNNVEYQSFSNSSSVTSNGPTLDLECKLQQNRANLPLPAVVEVESDSVVCSAVADVTLTKSRSSSEENVNSQPLIIGHFNMPVSDSNAPGSAQVQEDAKKPKQRRRRKKKNQDRKKEVEVVNLSSTVTDITDLTVEDVMKHPEWTRFVQKTGKVVHVLERKHTRIAAGFLKLCPDRNPRFALFSPCDSRVPRIMVPMSDCPQNFYHRPQDYASVLFLAKIVDWNETSTFAAGRVVKSLGNTGDVEVETEGLLIENDVEYGDFPADVLECLPQEENWQIPASEISRRRDFRRQCVFTIDPATARDMDDAVSCFRLENGNFEVGVHIADVTYFVQPGTALDKFAQGRSTSVYLVQKVIPMLPRLLCDNLCSLAPGEDRLTYSVVWEMTPEGEVRQQWIGRSVINSCCKLSYEHAQSLIENPGKTDWTDSEFPPVNGGFGIPDIAPPVVQLHDLAVQIRERRFDDGALKLDQVKLQFALDRETGLPSGFNVFRHKDSNKLIEEFMLLANMTVARTIYDKFPALSLLRRHPPPQQKMLDDIVAMCESMGVILDPASSGALQGSIARYGGSDFMSEARTQLLMNLCSKPMNCALYFCTGMYDDLEMYRHYALNVPFYTHFTSPIRRYPDIIVHRLLGASLRYGDPPAMDHKEMHKIADYCNTKKYNAKKVSDASGELFLAAFVREIGFAQARAIVVDVRDHSFDCLILDMGLIKRVYCDKLPLVKKQYKRSHGVSQLNIFWQVPNLSEGLEQVLVTFALVDVIVTVDKDSLKIKATLKNPGLC